MASKSKKTTSKVVASKPKLGRPRTGRRSDPDYRQVSAWVKKETYERVQVRLFTKEHRREFSDLLQSLLEGYLKTPLDTPKKSA
jgi:hypothetical protein